MNKKNDQIFLKYTQGVEPIKRKNRIKKGIKNISKNIVKQIQKTNKSETSKKTNTEKTKNSQFFLEA